MAKCAIYSVAGLLSFSLCLSSNFAAAETTEAAEVVSTEALELTASLVLKVRNRDETIEMLISQVEKQEGYFKQRTDDSLVLKIPNAKQSAVIDSLPGFGLVAEKTFDTRSRSEELDNLRARIQGRQDLLARYFEVLDGAESEGVLAVEQEVIRLVEELEGLKGQLRSVEHATTYATLTIHFAFQERRAPVASGRSNFQWLNELSLAELLSDLQHGHKPESLSVSGSLPSGFAEYHRPWFSRSSVVQGANPSGVVFRIRRVRPESSADLSFWTEALTRLVTESGYKSYDSDVGQPTSSVSGSGSLIKLLAPNGAEDFAYWIAIKAVEDTILVVEAAGEAAAFQSVEEAIQESVAKNLQ